MKGNREENRVCGCLRHRLPDVNTNQRYGFNHGFISWCEMEFVLGGGGGSAKKEYLYIYINILLYILYIYLLYIYYIYIYVVALRFTWQLPKAGSPKSLLVALPAILADRSKKSDRKWGSCGFLVGSLWVLPCGFFLVGSSLWVPCGFLVGSW